MARSSVQSIANDAQRRPAPSTAEYAEHLFRRRSAWIVLCLLLFGELGLAWDRRWHDYLGRDQFWIPPHDMMYTAVGCTGMIALFVVLHETRRYHLKKPGVDDSSTISIFRYFHAPLGFTLLGFGTLTDLIAAPFDNYWHQLYGIDVTLWSPFHLMGVFGAITAGLGIIYTFSSEVAYERGLHRATPTFLGFNGMEWGIIVLLAGFQEMLIPALTAFIPVPLGPIHLLTYPLSMTLVSSVCLVATYQTIRKRGVVVLSASILFILSILTEAYVVVGLHVMASLQGLYFRVGRPLYYNVVLALIPLFFLISAGIVEIFVASQNRAKRTEQSEMAGLNSLHHTWLIGVCIAVPAVVVPPALVYMLGNWLHIPLAFDNYLYLTPGWLDMLITIPVAMAVGAIASFVGEVFGDIWHWNKQ
jgi:hypothetical protein